MTLDGIVIITLMVIAVPSGAAIAIKTRIIIPGDGVPQSDIAITGLIPIGMAISGITMTTKV